MCKRTITSQIADDDLVTHTGTKASTFRPASDFSRKILGDKRFFILEDAFSIATTTAVPDNRPTFHFANDGWQIIYKSWTII
jgi:hypothetical protein